MTCLNGKKHTAHISSRKMRYVFKNKSKEDGCSVLTDSQTCYKAIVSKSEMLVSEQAANGTSKPRGSL